MVKLRRKTFHVVFAERRMVMGIYFGNVPFSPFNMCANCLSLLSLCPWIVVGGQGVCFGMVGCLVLMVCLLINPGLSLLVSLLPFILKGVLVLIRLVLMLPGLLLITGMLMILLWRCLSILMSGLMVAERIFPLLGV